MLRHLAGAEFVRYSDDGADDRSRHDGHIEPEQFVDGARP